MNRTAKYLCHEIMDKKLSSEREICVNNYLESASNINFLKANASCLAKTSTRCISTLVQPLKQAHCKSTLARDPHKKELKDHTGCNITKTQNGKHICDIKTTFSLNFLPLDGITKVKAVSVDMKDFRVTCDKSTCCDKETDLDKIQYEKDIYNVEMVKVDKAVNVNRKTKTFADLCAIGGCHRFSLGTADFRNLQYDLNKTMLIGGCRVPVCRNLKTRF